MKKKIRRLIKYGVVLIILVLIAYAFWPKPVKIEYLTETVVRSDVEQIVSATGTAESDDRIELRFEKPGTIRDINAEVGQIVSTNTLLAKLDTATLEIQAEQARANVASAQGSLAARQAGAPSQELDVLQKQIDSAQVGYDTALINLELARSTAQENERKSQVGIDSAQKTLENARIQKTNAEIAVKNAEKQYQNALLSQTNTKEVAVQALKNAYDNARSVINIALIQMKSAIPATDSVLGIEQQNLNDEFEDYLGVLNSESINRAYDGYIPAKTAAASAESEYNRIYGTWQENEVDRLISITQDALIKNKSLLSNVFTLLNNTISSGSFTLSELENLKTSMATQEKAITDSINSLQNTTQSIKNARLDISGKDVSTGTSIDNAKAAVDTAKDLLDKAISGIDTAENSLLTARSSLEQTLIENQKLLASAQSEVSLKQVAINTAKSSYDAKAAAPRPVDTASLAAQVNAAQAAYQLALQNIREMELVSPADGTITQVNKKVGESVSSADIMFVLISPELKIRANISETDIAKVKVNDPVRMTFDALSLDDVFTGKVASIDPAETIVQGVIYYQIKVVFDQTDNRIKPGMTANLDLTTEKRNSTLTISPQAIQYRDNKPFVKLLKDGQPSEVTVKLGLSGTKTVEILEGLNEGDMVILGEKKV